jgi:hypothetical protein
MFKNNPFAQKAIGGAVAITIILIILFALLPKPTDEWAVLYSQLMAKTSGNGPAIGLGGIDPLTDVVVVIKGRPTDVEFVIVAHDIGGERFNESDIQYTAGAGLTISDAKASYAYIGIGWYAFTYKVTMLINDSSQYHFTLVVHDNGGGTSTRLYLVIPW